VYQLQALVYQMRYMECNFKRNRHVRRRV